jgi:hypothetical protein
MTRHGSPSSVTVLGECVADTFADPGRSGLGELALRALPGGGPANTAVALARLGTVLRTGRSTRSSLFPSPECSKAASQSTAILSAPSQAELCRGTRFLGAAPAFNVTRSVLYLVVNACNAPAIVRLPARCHRVGPRPVRRHAPVPHRSDEAPQLVEAWQGDGMSWLAEGETGAKQVGGA